jgi:putative SOS response-associated peptidase YedK
MPAILPPGDWADWLDGPPDAAGLLCRPWELGMDAERMSEGGCGGDGEERVCLSTLRSKK